MITQISQGIKINVETLFQPNHSSMAEARFLFSYKITIENRNPFPVQLLHRNWYIFDSLSDARFITGEGVVGQQPIIGPEETFEYSSWCDLTSEIGMMRGFYVFNNRENGTPFHVTIPQFKLEFPGKMN